MCTPLRNLQWLFRYYVCCNQVYVSPAKASGMQLAAPEFSYSLLSAGPDGQLPPVDLSFLELPEQDMTQIGTNGASGFPAQPFVAQGKHAIFVDKFLGNAPRSPCVSLLCTTMSQLPHIKGATWPLVSVVMVSGCAADPV